MVLLALGPSAPACKSALLQARTQLSSAARKCLVQTRRLHPTWPPIPASETTRLWSSRLASPRRIASPPGTVAQLLEASARPLPDTHAHTRTRTHILSQPHSHPPCSSRAPQVPAKHPATLCSLCHLPALSTLWASLLSFMPSGLFRVECHPRLPPEPSPDILIHNCPPRGPEGTWWR